MEAYELYKEAGEELAESIKILNHKCGVGYTTRIENNIEATRTSVAVNNTFQYYINFLTEDVTRKRSRAKIF